MIGTSGLQDSSCSIPSIQRSAAIDRSLNGGTYLPQTPPLGCLADHACRAVEPQQCSRQTAELVLRFAGQTVGVIGVYSIGCHAGTHPTAKIVGVGGRGLLLHGGRCSVGEVCAETFRFERWLRLRCSAYANQPRAGCSRQVRQSGRDGSTGTPTACSGTNPHPPVSWSKSRSRRPGSRGPAGVATFASMTPWPVFKSSLTANSITSAAWSG